MVRLTRRIFNDLAIWMIGFGLLVGLVFPLVSVGLGIPTHLVWTPIFVTVCLSAGVLVGAVNIYLARNVVGGQLTSLSEHMRKVEARLRGKDTRSDLSGCMEECMITVDSEDALGESGKAFNYLLEGLRESRQTQLAVRSFSDILARHLELETLAQRTLEQLQIHLGADAGAILVVGDGTLQLAHCFGITNAASIADSEHVQRALKTQTRQRITLPADLQVKGVLVDFTPREVVVEPIVYTNIPLGVDVLAAAEPFAPEAIDRLDLFGSGMALAFNNALTHDRLQRLAALDPLTGIYNRRFGMARLREEFSRALRARTPLGVMMFDIDHFKKVNDTYGHLAGDRVLIAVAKTARAALREGDILVRYGGEEFLALLPAASKENIAMVAERLRRLVEDTVTADGDQEIRVTLSAWCTSYPEFEVPSEQDLVRRADEALYSAKETGRNHVVAR